MTFRATTTLTSAETLTPDEWRKVTRALDELKPFDPHAPRVERNELTPIVDPLDWYGDQAYAYACLSRR